MQEMVYRWMVEEYEYLRPLREAAGILVRHDRWPRLCDAEKPRTNAVPSATPIYPYGMYVARAFSEETAATIRGIRTRVTNEYEHNGLRADGERILDRPLGIAGGAV